MTGHLASGEGAKLLSYRSPPAKVRWSWWGVGSLAAACVAPLVVWVTFAVNVGGVGSLLGFFGPAAVAVVLGAVSIYQIRRSKFELVGIGFAVAGIALGAGWIGFWGFAWSIARVGGG